MSSSGQKKKPTFTVETRPRAGSDDSAPSIRAPSLKSPRAARFAEATAVNSPIEPKKLPFGETRVVSNHYMAQPQPSDVGFGYVDRHESVEMPDTDDNDYPNIPKSPLRSPLKSAMKTPGAAPRDFGDLKSATFKPEEYLEKREAHTDKQQAQDVRIKTRVRIAKMLLRGVNFSCSLIVLGMLASTFAIFNATKNLPPRNSLPPWAAGQKIWPQIVLLVIACFSLFTSLIIFYAYFRGGHKRAEKAAVYYTAFAVGFFVFSIVMWGIGAGIIQGAKTNSDNKDMWGWACIDNQRRQLFQNEVSYNLICRLQNWSLVCCIIEVVVETLTIAVYGVVFYRFYSKRQLRKSMAHRDHARSDLYLAQLRSQSAPNTPGFANAKQMEYWDSDIEDGYSLQNTNTNNTTTYLNPDAKPAPQPFTLQPAPVRKDTTPKLPQAGFTTTTRERAPTPPEELAEAEAMRSPLMVEQRQEHFAPVPGERVYEDVQIPGAYEAPLSPRFDEAPSGVWR